MLALVPAGFLVLILLSALAVDSSVAYLGQRQLHDTLTAAANDAASAGLDNAAFYRSGNIDLDPAAVARVVCASVGAQGASQLHDVRLWYGVDGSAVRLAGEAEVDVIFGKAVPGFGHRHVHAEADAVALRGPTGQAPQSISWGALSPLVC